MSKQKSLYVCNSCGSMQSKWSGKCPSCGAWNSIMESPVTNTKSGILKGIDNFPQKIYDISFVEEDKILLPDNEMNRVLGGGLVKGSLILMGGEPGIGKSTISLQIALRFPDEKKVLYVSGEESEKQIKLRAERLGIQNPNVYILSETVLENIMNWMEKVKPDIIFIDSIQTVYFSDMESAPGSVSQVRECTLRLMRYAKLHEVPIVLIGHVTKDGFLAGPKTLEHMVDTVLSFEGDRHFAYRMIRTFKNRFGSTSELGIYEMTSSGLKEVPNPSELFLNQSDESFSGVAIGATMEGNRPILLECQALVTDAIFGNPQRAVTGLDSKRMNLIIAVLEKKAGIALGNKDIFLNIAGGLKVEDTAVDLAFAMAIASSSFDMALSRKTAFIAEIGLTGEIRGVNRMEQGISEALKLGFENIVISSYNRKDITANSQISILHFEKLEQVIRYFF